VVSRIAQSLNNHIFGALSGRNTNAVFPPEESAIEFLFSNPMKRNQFIIPMGNEASQFVYTKP
jgi:hypothetical protein